jgi:hypothetical protein
MGSYVSPCGRLVLINNDIDGIMMDTRWNVMRQYIITILMAVYHNVGIPIAIAWGTNEHVAF